MTFYELLYKVVDLLEREGKTSYRALKREFEIDDETLDDIRQELVVVKEIARDVDGEMLVLIPTKVTSSKEEKPKKSIPSKEDVTKNKDPIVSEPHDSHDDEGTTKGATDRNKNPTPKKHVLKWLGAALVLIGVLLPWFSTRVTGMNYSNSVTGLELTQGLLSIAAGIIGGIAGIVANKKPLSLKWLGLLVLIAGVVIIGFTLDVINGVSGSDLSFMAGKNGMKLRQNPEIGVYITLFGGCLLFLGGLSSLFREKKAIQFLFWQTR